MAVGGDSRRDQPKGCRANTRTASSSRPRLLESALARPQNSFAYGEEDIAALAVRLLAGVAQAHAFAQGNKRTCFVAMVQFLNANGYDLMIEDSERWADEVIALVEHRIGEDEFVRAIRPFVFPTP